MTRQPGEDREKIEVQVSERSETSRSEVFMRVRPGAWSAARSKTAVTQMSAFFDAMKS
jgi:hypothetical protein